VMQVDAIDHTVRFPSHQKCQVKVRYADRDSLAKGAVRRMKGA
jgi:hypothetical protein